MNLSSSAALRVSLLGRYGRSLLSLCSQIRTNSTNSDDDQLRSCVAVALKCCKMSRVNTTMEMITCRKYVLDKKQSDDAADLKLFRLWCVRHAYTDRLSQKMHRPSSQRRRTLLSKFLGPKYIETAISRRRIVQYRDCPHHTSNTSTLRDCKDSFGTEGAMAKKEILLV